MVIGEFYPSNCRLLRSKNPSMVCRLRCDFLQRAHLCMGSEAHECPPQTCARAPDVPHRLQTPLLERAPTFAFSSNCCGTGPSPPSLVSFSCDEKGKIHRSAAKTILRGAIAVRHTDMPPRCRACDADREPPASRGAKLGPPPLTRKVAKMKFYKE